MSTSSVSSSDGPASEALTRLALDLHWSWNHSADEVWKRLDPELWELTGNPWVILQTTSAKKLASIADSAFCARVEQILAEMQEKSASPGWFQTAHPTSPLRSVAYFSMEYMLSEALPIYSGGLGNVAGDQLKAASDLGVPVVAVGLLYQQGYFRQEIDIHGEQLELYPVNEPGQLPIRPVRNGDGEWLRLRLTLPDGRIWIRTWEVQVGRTKLYLLDTNDPANLPRHRGITSELYGGGPELRLKQELLLGVVGWQLLQELGIEPEVCHLNEGHAAFAILERARSYMERRGLAFHEALAVTRAGNVFTTHTAVEAGFDRFAPELIRQYVSEYAQAFLGISLRDLLSLGRRNPEDEAEPFNMAYLAIRGSGSANGVSSLHGQVSRHLFQSLFPRFPVVEVPIGHVTNGIHVPTWDSSGADRLWTEVCGKGVWRSNLADATNRCQSASELRIWQMRAESRTSLVNYARDRTARQEAGHGASTLQLQQARAVLDPDTLTLGFARRFATYKRPTLLLYDRDRLARILTNPQAPAQLIVAGKAHPKDLPGQALIREWVDFAIRPDVSSHVIFLSDYDMLLAERLMEGVDVWINTPRRPWEASGTSGMKVLVNGGLNLSTLDGWWAEAYSPEVGWAIGDGQEHSDDPEWDRRDADALYAALENEIVPEFYKRDEAGIPQFWVSRIRNSMARLTPAFSANRTVRQYTEEHYLPAASAYALRASREGKGADGLLTWRRALDRYWRDVHFVNVRTHEQDGALSFDAELCLGALEPNAVRVELYAEAQDGGAPIRQEMRLTESRVGNPGDWLYSALVHTSRAASDFTPRVLPYHTLATPLEINHVVWQR